MKGCVYINPRAPAEVKGLIAAAYSDVTEVSAEFIEELTGGFADEGPRLSEYAAAIVDEEGELHLMAPVIPHN